MWFLLSCLFYPMGKFFDKIWDDTKYNIKKDDKKEEVKND